MNQCDIGYRKHPQNCLLLIGSTIGLAKHFSRHFDFANLATFSTGNDRKRGTRLGMSKLYGISTTKITWKNKIILWLFASCAPTKSN